MTPIRTALIGYGISGACFHAPILKTLHEFEIVAVQSSRPDEVHADLPAARVHADLATLLADAEVDLCVVATPNELHYPQARACLEAGKHVVVEKPFVLETRHGLELGELVRERGRVLAVYQSRRWDGDFLTLRRAIDEGRLGRPHTLISHYDRWRPEVRDRWREHDVPGAGILWDLGAHLVDQAICLFGYPERVSARLRCMRPGAAATDHFHIALQHAGGASAILHGDCLTLEPGPRLQVHGDGGSFVKYGYDAQEVLLRRKLGPGQPDWGTEPQSQWARVTSADDRNRDDTGVRTLRMESERGCYEAFYHGLAASILKGASPPVDALAGTRVVATLRAAIESDREGRAVATPVLHGPA